MFAKRYWRVQSEVSECGLACLAICSSILGSDLNMSELRGKYHNSQRGVNLKQLVALGSALDLQCRSVKVELSEIADLALPAILHWNLNHFVVLERVHRGKFKIIDPAHGSLDITHEELSSSFTGVAIEVSAAPTFKPRKNPSPLSIWSIVNLRGNTGKMLFKSVIYSLLLQFFVIVLPYITQLAIDEGVVRGDESFLLAVIFGFAFITVFNSLTEILRGMAIQKASALIGWDMSRRLFHHMIALPLPWFHRRKLADALSRLESVDPIRNLISNGLISALIDGFTSLGLIVVMLIYSTELALISIGSAIIYVLLKIFTLSVSMKVGMRSLQASIAERGSRIETLKAIQSIKTMGGEYEREAGWANKYAELVSSNLSNSNLRVYIESAKTLIDGVALVLIIYIGGKNVIGGAMTVGALYAFISYKGQFFSRMTTLIDQCVSWRLTELHTDRIADIALSAREDGYDKDPNSVLGIDGSVELSSVTYNYSQQESPVIKAVSVLIENGEFVAITGPSGCGKSTLIRLISGLYPASSGTLRIGGHGISHIGARVARQCMGVVMQDDELLTGSILDNVTFFSESPDIDFVWNCLQVSCLDQDVRNMPMQLETHIGDMGSTLSGGQRQRILLARAIYRRPKILILDEATSNLDVSTEKNIYSKLSMMSITRIVITHRPETMKMAERLLILDEGRLISDLRKDPNQPRTTTEMQNEGVSCVECPS